MEGSGCVLVQNTERYATPSAARGKSERYATPSTFRCSWKVGRNIEVKVTDCPGYKNLCSDHSHSIMSYSRVENKKLQGDKAAEVQRK